MPNAAFTRRDTTPNCISNSQDHNDLGGGGAHQHLFQYVCEHLFCGIYFPVCLI